MDPGQTIGRGINISWRYKSRFFPFHDLTSWYNLRDTFFLQPRFLNFSLFVASKRIILINCLSTDFLEEEHIFFLSTTINMKGTRFARRSSVFSFSEFI